GVVADDLRGSGLAAELNPGELELAASAAAFVDDAIHGVGYFFDRAFGNWESFFSHVGRVLQHVWLLKDATHGDTANHTSELQRGSRDGALADGNRNGLTRIPLTMKHPLDPFGRRHQTRLFGGEIDSGFMPEAELAAVV